MFNINLSFAAPKDVVITKPLKSAQASVSPADCIGKVQKPTKLILPIGKSTIIDLPEPVANRTVGDVGVLQAKMLSPQTLYLLGVNIGSTNMLIQGTKGACMMIDVVVNLDAESLQSTLTELMPNEKAIKVSAAADSLVLSGSVENALVVDRVLEIANAFVRKPTKAVDLTPDGNTKSDNSSSLGSQNNQRQLQISPRVINLLSVGSLQQVMLQVKIAEVSKTLVDKLGVNATLGGDYGVLANFLTDSAGVIGKLNGNGFKLDAEKKDGLVKILAEPTILAISGQEGSFLAGGKIFIPVAQQNNAGTGSTITLEEKEFGVGVKFTPTVLSGGRINLKVAPEVSELNKEGVGITSGIVGTSILPSFTTRRATTTVQLMDGQSFAIGGLIKNNSTANIKAFPILGEIPILGALFRSSDFQKDKTELVFVVTPRLVKPLSKPFKLPTDNYTEPSRADLFLNGRLEGNVKQNGSLEESIPAQEIKPDNASNNNQGVNTEVK